MRKHILLLALIVSVLSTYAQKPSIVTNYFYRAAPFNDSGVSMEGIMPIAKHVFFAPEIGCSIGKDYFDRDTKINSRSLHYGINAHYAIHFRNSESFISPFAGLGGITIWNDYTTNYTNKNDRLEKSKFYKLSEEGTKSYILANVGLSFKWYLGDLFYINTQAKYSIFTKKDIDANYFSFSAGIGFIFNAY